MRRPAVAALIATAGVIFLTETAHADVLVNVSKTSQRMAVLVDGSARYNWKVSTGRGRYVTPSGVFQAQWMARKWRSKQYHNAPMPYSIFFHNGYAIHGTTEISSLGRVASHGCVRLHPEHAAKLFALVQDQLDRTRVVVSNDTIEEPAPQQPRKSSPYVAQLQTGPERVSAPAADVIPASVRAGPKDVMVDRRSGAREYFRAPPPFRRTVERFEYRPGFRW